MRIEYEKNLLAQDDGVTCHLILKTLSGVTHVFVGSPTAKI